MKESEWELEQAKLQKRRLSPAQLLDIETMKKLDKKTIELRKLQAKEKTPEILKKLDNRDNATSLNRMGTETGKILEWGVDPDD